MRGFRRWGIAWLMAGSAAALGIVGASDDPHDTARIFDVCPEGCPFSRIQPALDAASVAGVDHPAVVQVAPGTYRENLAIGITGSRDRGRVTLAGYSRDSVRIVGADSAVDTLQVFGGPAILSDLTVVTLGVQADGINAMPGQANDLTIRNVRVLCESGEVALAVSACVEWDSSSATGIEPRFFMESSILEWSGTGLYLLFGGTVRILNNAILQSPNAAANPVNRFGIYHAEIDASGITGSNRFDSQGDRVRVVHRSTDTPANLAGVLFTNSAVDTLSSYWDTFIEIDDASAAGLGVYDRGFFIDAAASDATHARCFNCEIQVDVPNSARSTAAVYQGADAAEIIGLYGGQYNAANSDGSARDLNNASGVAARLTVTAGTDFDTIAGLFNSEGALVLPGADLVPGACIPQIPRLDTGGANQEICICNSAGTAWTCVTATTAAGPTN